MTTSDAGQESAPLAIGLDLNDEAAARARSARRHRLNVVQIPALRLFGIVMVAVFVYLYNDFLLPVPTGGFALTFAVVGVTYAGLSWLILAAFFGRLRAVDLGVVFLTADIAVLSFATYCSGDERSWLYFLPLVRVADQTSTSFRG